MDTVIQPVIKLRRLQKVILCPGCSRLFDEEEECAGHLLKTCIRFRSDDDYDSRRCFLMWIIDYHKTYMPGDQNPPEAVKIKSLLNDKNISSCLKASLKVNLPEVPDSFSCPVCKLFFYDTARCADHLFRKCLYCKNDDASLVQSWLTEYFSLKTENSLGVLREVLANYSSAKLFCKYCKIEALDRESLMKHFPSCPQSKSENLRKIVCAVCNFSVAHESQLLVHILSKHIRCCTNCDFRPKKDNANFVYLKDHLKTCVRNVLGKVRCPICHSNVLVDAKRDFENHLLQCRRPSTSSVLDVSFLYGECDICFKEILLCDIDAHLREHLIRKDPPSSRPKRLRLSLADLEKFVIDEENDNVGRPCACNGNLS